MSEKSKKVVIVASSLIGSLGAAAMSQALATPYDTTVEVESVVDKLELRQAELIIKNMNMDFDTSMYAGCYHPVHMVSNGTCRDCGQRVKRGKKR